MSLLYNKIPKLQNGSKVEFPRAIHETTSDNPLEDADYFIESTNSDPIRIYEMLAYNDDFTQPSPKEATSQENPVTYKVKDATLKQDIPYQNSLRDNLPFENEYEWFRYRDFINEKEMSGRNDKDALKKFNRLGYVGPYQMGTMALQEAKLLKTKLVGKGQRAQILNPDNWKGGLKSQKAFFSDLRIQEDALKRYTAKNFKYIKGSLLAHGITDKDTIMGYLAGTHLAGQKNVRQYIRDNGSNFVDGNGTSIDVYRNGLRDWIADKYKDGQGSGRYFDKRKAEETLKQKGILIRREDYFPEDYRVPGNKTQPWQDSD